MKKETTTGRLTRPALTTVSPPLLPEPLLIWLLNVVVIIAGVRSKCRHSVNRQERGFRRRMEERMCVT